MLDERVQPLAAWNAVVVAVSIGLLGLGIWKAVVCGLFVWASCAMGYGTRWLLRIGFLVGIVGFAVWLGLPTPHEWLAAAHQAAVALKSQF